MSRMRKGAIAATVVSTTLALIFGVKEVSQREFGVADRGQPVGRVQRAPSIREIDATQKIKYHSVGAHHDGWGPGRTLESALRHTRSEMSEKANQGNGYRVWVKGNPAEGTNRVNLKRAIRALRHRLINQRQHKVIYLKSMHSGLVYRHTKWDIDPAKWANTNGTPAIDIIVGTALARHPGLRLMGIFTCRTTVYGGWSQHAWANAADFGGTYTVMNAAAHDLHNLKQKGWVPVSQIIWQGHELFSGRSIYDHYDHVHFSGSPLRTGTPPCAQ